MNGATDLTYEETQLLSQAIFEKLSSADATVTKQAVDAVNDFTRTTVLVPIIGNGKNGASNVQTGSASKEL